MKEESAFPCYYDGPFQVGMTKREYFAGLAMQALITAHGSPSRQHDIYADEITIAATAYADELLKKLADSEE
ncbi:hypothetical protein NG799_21890 [Laspinema sp. D1]|uniref:Uncharacterized protein n=1 Tax=Laspinema palackyanum D2a TaxID=2953684 RepID=A0ABT2MW45_9CYAN|nr:hypothetical protein [Laspinema sp. D2a]